MRMVNYVFFLVLLPVMAFSQEACFLGIGGRDDETIKEFFKLSNEQFAQLQNWSAEIKIRNEILETKADKLLEKHETSSPHKLRDMAYQYRQFIDSMQNNIIMLDKKMLQLFTEDQYNIYLNLCNQLYLKPLNVQPSRSANEK